MSEPLLSPELFEKVLRSDEGSRWFSALEERARASGMEDPEAAAKGEMRTRLTSLLEGLAARYQDIKLGALDRIVELQERASAFIDDALASNRPPDVEAFQDVLRNMDTALDDLENGIEEVRPASAGPPEPPEPPDRPGGKPRGEPPPAKPGEKLGVRFKLTKEQRAYFREWKKAAAGNPEELERMRYERNETVRRNRGETKPRSFEEYKALLERLRPEVNRERGTAEARELRPAVSEYVGRPLSSGDSFPTASGKASKFEITMEVDGEQVTTRPDGVTLDASGKLAPDPVIQEHKFWSGGPDGAEIPDTDQMRAQREFAKEHGGRHVVSISADSPDLDAIPPRPRPDTELGKRSDVVFVDRTTKRVTRVWSPEEGKWIAR